ncbi:MAG: HAD family phosphatase [Roseiflexaceae bacterium]|nr:HAD family phosphatase [Roseiflexaceae bacterium]
MMYKLIALDLDGTLLDERMAIQPPVRAAVAAAQAQGVAVTIATGRTFRATRPYAEALGVHDPVICYQGGAIFDSQTGVMSDPVTIPGTLAAEGAQAMLDLGLFCLVYADERLYIADDTRPELEYYLAFHPEGVDLVVTPDLVEITKTLSPLKVQFTAEPGVIDRHLASFQARFNGRMEVLRAHDHYLELTPLGVSKGTALAKLAAHMGVPQAQVMAIGDHFNDLEMIEWAGLGLAMANGAPEVQARADAIIPSVYDHGVAWAIERYVLGQE